MTLGRMIATVAAAASAIFAVLLAGYGVLLWVAIPSSDSATSSLFLVGLVLVAAGLGFALFAWMLLRLRRGRDGHSTVTGAP
jgi:hypothetical protein